MKNKKISIDKIIDMIYKIREQKFKPDMLIINSSDLNKLKKQTAENKYFDSFGQPVKSKIYYFMGLIVIEITNYQGKPIVVDSTQILDIKFMLTNEKAKTTY